MTGAEMLTIILSILIPTLSGLGWVIVKIFGMKKEISGIRCEMLEMKIELLKEIRVLDSRLSHLEGYLIGSAQKTGTNNQ